jgi:small-conductance mechanosensitive channel
MINYLASRLHIPPVILDIILLTAVFVAALLVGFLIRHILRRWSARLHDNKESLALQVLESLAPPVTGLLALDIGLKAMPLPQRYQHFGSKFFFAIGVAIIFYFLGQGVVLFLRRLARKDPHLLRITQPGVFITRVLFGVLALIVVLENVGVSLTAVWTTLGVGSVAIGLALQETLANFFAGINLLADRPLNPGDHVKLDSGQEGDVVRVGWRTTELRSSSGDLIFVPNSKMASAVITNYSQRETSSSISVPVKVSAKSDPEKVEKVLVEAVGEAAQESKGAVLNSPPRVLLTSGLGDSQLEFQVNVQVRQSADQEQVKNALRKHILKRYQEGAIQLTT